MRRSLLAIAVLILAFGCTGHVVKRAEVAPPIVFENGPEPIVYFCPQDNCSRQFLRLAGNATSIDCAFYDLNIPPIIHLLEKKEARVFVDDGNAKAVNSTDLIYELDHKTSLSHNKFCVLDNSMVWTGSFNPTMSEDKSNNNNVIVFSSRYLAENYEDEFNELWYDRFGERVNYPIIYLNDHRIENYFCPEDCDVALQRVVQLIRQAKQSVYFMTFSFTEEEIANALIDKHNASVAVRGIFEKSENSRYCQYKRLREAGVDARFDSNKKLMHHKVFIIDERIVVTGSWNPTKSGTKQNDENIIIIDDEATARKYVEEFNRLWPG
jgi:phosphatidylserine/phosphatidylglycerophosphate/cardiolipin synthase-like enzyme